MTSDGISQQVREGSLSEVASDIPAGVTLAEYAAARRRKPAGRLKARVAWLRRSRKPR
jgi:hypothetical protein